MSPQEYAAHIATDGREQSVAAHLDGVARRAAAFAADFEAADYGRLVGAAHDIGKCSDAFQRRLRGGSRVDHATAGAIECNRQNPLAACCVIGHHGGLPDFGNPVADHPGDPTFQGRLKNGQTGGIPPYDWRGNLPPVGAPPKAASDPLALSLWTRMLYSCLVDADYLDTEAFMQGDSGRGQYDPLPVLLERLERHIAPWWSPKTELNRHRCAILRTCLDKGDQPRGLYTLTVPTGGGKTVASLAFALRHAVAHDMKRIVYVIPYTSIIEQNAAVFRDILGERNVLEHHSGMVCDDKEELSPQSLAAENWDAPVVVTTAVQFFESLYANRSSKCRKLHNLANSVLIFDEAQMLPTAHLAPCVAAIAHLVAHFRATAVLCTATQPALEDLLRRFAPSCPVQELCPETAALYDQFRRVAFQQAGKLTTHALAQRLNAQKQVLCIVNTRKAAQETYEQLEGEGCFHLSTLMYPAHRQQILKTIRKRLEDGLPCRVVSTSLIEAGVDVDFPVVYREMAGLDSILQAAGRCNREGNRPATDSIVTIFEGETAPPPLFRMNIGAAREALANDRDPGNPDTIRHYFTAYRSLVGDGLDKSRVVEHLRDGLGGCLFPFESVARDFRFLDDATKTVYIPREEGAVLTEALLSGCASRQTYRQAGRYGVNVYENHFRALLAAGDAVALDDDSAVLTNAALYDEARGLSTTADYGKAQFI